MANSWVIPCNPKVYDVEKHFSDNEIICWKKSNGIKTGDYIYVYIGVPRKAIMFKCVVINDNVDATEMKKHSYATKGNLGSGCKYMKLRKEKVLQIPVSLEVIQKLGIYMIRKQMRVDRKLLCVLEPEHEI